MKHIFILLHMLRKFLSYSSQNKWEGCRVMVYNTISTLFQLYRGGQFYWWSKIGEPRENH